ncbi:MAG: hypothetical protein ACK5JH_16740 [Anaerocolumna sp.]
MSTANLENIYTGVNEKELKKIKDKYRDKTFKETKMQQLISLDKSVSNTANKVSLSLGVLGSLVLGIGMVCTMVWTEYFNIGIVVGIIGIIICGITYPVYLKMVERKRSVIAPQIIRLAEEIEKGE